MPEGASCFGFEIRSPVPFVYLRAGRGEALDITVQSEASAPRSGHLIYDWVPRAGHEFHARLHQDGNLYRFWVDGTGSFMVDPGGRRIWLPDAADSLQREERLWGIPAALCMLHRGDLPVHAAAVDVGGQAVLFGAPGRFGKSTLAAGFHMAGHRILSEDLSCVRLTPAVSVVPGPAMLRIRRDVAGQLTLSGASVAGGDPDRVSLALSDSRRGSCRPVPLRAVVLLRESVRDVTVEPVASVLAVPDLMSLCFRFPTPEGRAACLRAVVNLVRSVPIWDLHRPLRLEDLPETVARIVEACLTGRAA